MRKKAKTEAIDVDEFDPTNTPLDTDDTDIKPEQYKMEVDEDEVEPDSELQEALQRARRMQQEKHVRLPALQDILANVKDEPQEIREGSGLILDSTAEFCRTLGEAPGYEAAHSLDVKMEDDNIDPDELVKSSTGAWSRVEHDIDVGPPKIEQTPILDEEPELGGGLAGALKVALSKGYLEKDDGPGPARMSAKALKLMAINYSIDDKAVEDDKYSRRERGHDRYSGPTQDFREKEGFKPDVKLEYIDDDGRPLCPKEAFRYLSHKFHGKGPGKNKQEKRIKKNIKEGLMKQMSSTDTPLGTLAMLQEKQKELQMPYIPLSKTKKDPI